MRFVTLFPRCTSNCVLKDVGQIPYTISQQCNNWDTELVSAKIDLESDYVKDVPGLKIVQIPFWGNEVIAGLVYLLKNSKRIDCLNIYHYGHKSLYWSKVYKHFNPKGLVYLKLDMDFIGTKKLDNNKSEQALFKRTLDNVDLVSVESRPILKRIKKYTTKKIIIVPNGYYENQKTVDESIERKNRFVTAARLGTKQKATELLVEAFLKTIDQHDWKLELIGSCEPTFIKWIETLFEKESDLKNRIIIKGQITNHEELYKEYLESKVFVLPSRWEASPLVIPEAMLCGCKLILSDSVPVSTELICDNQFGYIVKTDSCDDLAQIMLRVIREKYSEEDSKRIASYAQNNFKWSKICGKLVKEIELVRAE